MFQMINFKTFIVIQYFWTLTLCNPDLIKYNIIKSREIFKNREIVTLENLVKEDDFVLTDTSEYPYEMYTSIQCTYADTVIDLLQTFFEIFLYGVNLHEKINNPEIKSYTKNWLISAMNNFNNIKIPITKIIDHLFFYLDLVKELRTSDQSLLKSLLSVNLFLCHSINSNSFIVYSRIETNDQDELVYIIDDNDFYETIINVRLLNTSIIQMIGLVERFRSKRCVVHEPYQYHYDINEEFHDNLIQDVWNIQRLLAPTLQRINVLTYNGSDNDSDFNSNKFNPDYLLFGNLVNHNNWYLGNIQIAYNGQKSNLLSILYQVTSTFSIEHVLEFQHTLIKVIAEVFYTQIYNLSMNTLNDNTIKNLMKLQGKFSEFVYNMLPSNCSINICNKILKARVFLDKTLESFNHSKNPNILKELREQFIPANNIELINQNYQNNFNKDPFLSSLIDKMWNDTQNETFRRVFRLLSYESFTNSDFNISIFFNYVDSTSSQSYDAPFFNTMVELQYALFAYLTIIKMEIKPKVPNNIKQYSTVDLKDLFKIGFRTPANRTGNSRKGYRHMTSEILRVVVKFYINSENRPAIQNILLPFLIHSQHIKKNSPQLSVNDLFITIQMSFLTISLIDNYLTRNYSFAFYSMFLYNTFIMNTQEGPDVKKLKHDLNSYAESSKISFKDALDFLNFLYDVDLYTTFFPESDRQIEFVWNGSSQCGYDIYHNILTGVTDFNDLIRLQWFGVKQFASELFLILYSVLSLFSCDSIFQNTCKVLNSKLYEFMEIEFPRPIKIFLDDVFNSILITIRMHWTSMDGTIFEKIETIFSDSFSALDVHHFHTDSSGAETEMYINAMNIKFDKLKRFSSLLFFGKQNKLNSTDFGLSPIQEEISDKIIKILI